MGICYRGKTLKEAVKEKEQLFKESGYAYGLEKLELLEEDPAELMKFQLRILAACINARETAKLISNNPISAMMGELLFLLATPEGDVVAASHGLIGHVQSIPFIIRSIAELDFEEDPEIRDGDIFSTNDPHYGGTHGSDCFTLVPVFYKGELIAWAAGLNHIADVGGIAPGNMSPISPNAFTDGFLYPPTKTGENFKQHKWWELYWKRRTRTEAFNILDDKMRVTGAVMVHNRVLEILEEFGVDYFRRGMKEILERERRLLIERIRTLAVPGIYHYLRFQTIRYKGVVGKVFPSSDRDWLTHGPAELHILPEGKLLIDLEGVTSEADFHANSYESQVRMGTSLGTGPMFAHSSTLNTALMYINDWKLPPGSACNPQNPQAGTAMGAAISTPYLMLYHECLSNAYFAKGFLEECLPMCGTAGGYGLDGVLADGLRWAGGGMGFVLSHSSDARPYKDGEPAVQGVTNPASDLGEVEQFEFIEPTNLSIGRKLVPNFCGHGKFRGGLGMNAAQLICDPGQHLTVAVFGLHDETSGQACGMCGGYPGLHMVIYFVHDTNMRELLDKGLPYPTDFPQAREWLKEGKLKGRVECYSGSTPNVELKDGDLFIIGGNAAGGWGDPLERELSLVERDVHYGWLTPDVVKGVYGVVVDKEGKVKVKESEELRQKMRERRKARSVDAKDWWRKEREQILRKEFSEDVYNMYADSLKYDKFRRQFMGMWQLPEDYGL